MKVVIDIDEKDYEDVCRIGGLILPKEILYMFRNATPLEEVLNCIKTEIEGYENSCDLTCEETSSCRTCNNVTFGSIYRIIEKHISGKE